MISLYFYFVLSANVFCVLEDPAAPMRADYLANPSAYGPHPPTHFRHTFPTLSPPHALEQLIAQLRARWAPVRAAGRAGAGAESSSGSSSSQQREAGAGPQLVVEGHVYAIGSDWLVRAGNVIMAGGAVKGMLLEVRGYADGRTVWTDEIFGTDLGS